MNENNDNKLTCKKNVAKNDESKPACPVCGGNLIEIRAKFQCTRCHRICETCCEGGRG